VAPPGASPSGAQREQLEALRRLGSVLGSQLIVEEGDDVADAAARVARERGTTYVFMGQPHAGRGLRRFAESLPEALMRRLPGVDVRIVADPPG
jgi:two-component system, OmpR family, sensor histidine kinase KdpD